jgi:hypothetical protein
MVNWRAYNESLVRRGKVMLDFDVIDGWEEEELEKMNEGKVGEYTTIQNPLSSYWGR